MLVLGGGAVLIGMSERTRPQGVERLARALFAGGEVDRIVALRMPETRALMHLDTVMTMVDPETFTKYAGLGMLPAYTVGRATTRRSCTSPTTRREDMHRRSPTRSACRRSGCSPPRRTCTRPSASSGTTAATRWPSRPGVVVTYERNVTTNTLPAPARHRGARPSPAASWAAAAAGRGA